MKRHIEYCKNHLKEQPTGIYNSQLKNSNVKEFLFNKSKSYNFCTNIKNYVLSSDEKNRLKNTLINIPYPDKNYEHYIESISLTIKHLKDILFNIFEFHEKSPFFKENNKIIRIKNLPQDNINKPPKDGGSLKKIHKPTYLSENLLSLFGCYLGNPYSVYCEGKGLINNLLPSSENKNNLTGLGSASELDFHIENAAIKFLSKKNCSPDILMFLGLSADIKASPYTKFSDASLALKLLTDEEVHILQQPFFKIKLPYRWRDIKEKYHNLTTHYIPLISFNPDLEVNAAFYGDMLAECKTEKALRAAQSFREALIEVERCITINPGELICFENKTILHSRTPFEATFDKDGNPYRWLQRIFIHKNLNHFNDWKQEDERVFTPTF